MKRKTVEKIKTSLLEAAKLINESSIELYDTDKESLGFEFDEVYTKIMSLVEKIKK